MTEYIHNSNLLLPEDVIPHCPPSLWVTGVQELIPGKSIKGFWIPDDEQFLGHFPDEPVLMGNKQVEALCQLGCYVVMCDNPGKLAISLAGTNRARFPEPVFPSETLELSVDIIKQEKRLFEGIGRAAVNGLMTCEVNIEGTIISKALQARALRKARSIRATSASIKYKSIF